MIFTKLKLEGAYLIDIDKKEDSRGFFARIFCKREFKEHGLKTNILQANTGFNYKKGTLRGLHYQNKPFSEAKLVRCTKGAVYDVIVDLRKDSKTYKQWVGVELTEDNFRMIYVPEGFAHGYITLKANSVVMYFVSEYYNPKADAIIRFNDPSFKIKWPLEPKVITDRDKNQPDFVG